MKKPSIKEQIDLYLAQIASPELLSEISYNAFNRTINENNNGQKIKKAFRLMNRKLNEMEQVISHVNKFKTTLHESEWEPTAQLKEILKEKVKSIYKEIKNL